MCLLGRYVMLCYMRQVLYKYCDLEGGVTVKVCGA